MLPCRRLTRKDMRASSDRYLILIPDCAVSEMPFISVMVETSRLPQT